MFQRKVMLINFFSPLVLTAILANIALANDTPNGQCQHPPAYIVSAVDDLIVRSPRITLAVHAPFDAGRNDSALPEATAIDRERELDKATESGAEPERVMSAMSLAKFEVLEDIKGEGPDDFYLAHTPEQKTNANDTFNDHENEHFWSDPKAGRTALSADCAIAPSFRENATYLIFTGQPHVKAYERVGEPDDAWLVYVRKFVTAE